MLPCPRALSSCSPHLQFVFGYSSGDITQAQLKALATALGAQQLLLALPLLPSAAAALAASAAAGSGSAQYAALAKLSSLNLFQSGLLTDYATQSAYCQQQVGPQLVGASWW